VGFSIEDLVLRLPVVLFSLTVHEFMHAWAAWKCGDDTARLQGRLTLNPLAHLDLMGTIMLILPGSPIGWAKPVPVNPNNYESPRRDDILVSGAGVTANFALGVLCALALRYFGPELWAWGDVGKIVVQMLLLASFINFGLAVFNLVPIFPLDGSHILKNLLPLNAAIAFRDFKRHGPWVLLAFIVVNQIVARTYGISILGYPINGLMVIFAGFGL